MNFFPPQTSVAKLLNVYRYNFPDTTIIMANPTLRIYWSGVSILEAGLDCMEQLLQANANWKFFFNSIGTALPGRPIHVCSTQYVCSNSLGMGRVKTQPEIWPDPRVFWPTRPDPNNFSKDPSQPVVIFS